MYSYIWIQSPSFNNEVVITAKTMASHQKTPMPIVSNSKGINNNKGIVGPRPNHSDEMFEPTFVMIIRECKLIL